MVYCNLCKLVAAATLFSVLVRLRAFSLAGGFEHGGLAAVMSVLSLATFVLALASVAGLWNGRSWGFIAFYAFAILFTLLFGASLIPFVPLLLPVGARFAGVLVLNALVVALVAFLHWKYRGRNT